MRTSKPKLCQKPTQGSDCKICRSGRYNLCPKMRFIGSAVNRVPGALCQKFNHKVGPKKTVAKKTHIRGCCKIQKTTEGWPKKNIKIKAFMKNPMFQVIQSDLLDTKVGGHQQPLVKGHESPSQKGHPGIARFYKGCLGAGFARHLIATSFHRTLVCKRARCWATQMAEGMKSWHVY